MESSMKHSAARQELFLEGRFESCLPERASSSFGKRLLKCWTSRTLIAAAIIFVFLPPVCATTKYEKLSTDGEKAYSAGNFSEAERLFVQALQEAEKMDKSDHRIATTAYNLGLVYQVQEKFKEAEEQYLAALDLLATVYGEDHQRVGQVYVDLGDLKKTVALSSEDPKSDRAKAAEYYQKAVDIFESLYDQAESAKGSASSSTEPVDGKTSTDDDLKKASQDSDKTKKGSENQSKGTKQTKKLTSSEAGIELSKSLTHFADFYADDEDYDKAEPLYKRALEFEEAFLPEDDIKIARSKAHLAEMYCVQSKYTPAEPLFREALAILDKNPTKHIDKANIMYNFGGLYYDQGSFSDAEKYFRESIKIFEQVGTQSATDLALKNVALADVLDMQGKTEEGQALYKKSLDSLEKGSDINALLSCLKAYEKHLNMLDNKSEAEKVHNRIKELRAKAKGSAEGG